MLWLGFRPHRVCILPLCTPQLPQNIRGLPTFLLETFRFLHFPLLAHPSAQERLGVFPVFWLLYLACPRCLPLASVLLPASLAVWGHPGEAKQNSIRGLFLPHFSPKPRTRGFNPAMDRHTAAARYNRPEHGACEGRGHSSLYVRLQPFKHDHLQKERIEMNRKGGELFCSPSAPAILHAPARLTRWVLCLGPILLTLLLFTGSLLLKAPLFILSSEPIPPYFLKAHQLAAFSRKSAFLSTSWIGSPLLPLELWSLIFHIFYGTHLTPLLPPFKLVEIWIHVSFIVVFPTMSGNTHEYVAEYTNKWINNKLQKLVLVTRNNRQTLNHFIKLIYKIHILLTNLYSW